MERSLIYRHIALYRVAMTVLYGGRYRERFERVLRVLGPPERSDTSIVEYCFGDTILAEACVERGVHWTGVDLNPHFCERARDRGLQAIEGDLFQIETPISDAAVMIGSLYHFHDRLDELFERVLARTPRWVLSEPVKNLSSRDDLLGRLARVAANPGDGHAPFRFTESSLLETLDKQQARLGFAYTVVDRDRDLVVDIRA